MSTENSHDPIDELDGIRAQAGPVYARKLSFSERCALFLALNAGERSAVVEKAYGLSKTTISALRHCLTTKRYQEIANEYRRLGYEQFARTYFTQDVAARLKAARLNYMDLLREVSNLPPPVPGGSDPRARKYEGEHVVKTFDGDGNPVEHRHRIEWTKGRSGLEGWAIYDVEYQTWGGEGSQTGEPTGKPYRTSTDAIRDLYAGYGLEGPAKKIGRPRK